GDREPRLRADPDCGGDAPSPVRRTVSRTPGSLLVNTIRALYIVNCVGTNAMYTVRLARRRIVAVDGVTENFDDDDFEAVILRLIVPLLLTVSESSFFVLIITASKSIRVGSQVNIG